MKHIGYMIWDKEGHPLTEAREDWDFYFEGEQPDFVSLSLYDYWMKFPGHKKDFIDGKIIKKVYVEE